MNPQVDIILEEGCGRCKLVGTPQCRIIIRNLEMKALREIALDTGLDEEVKWGFPTYTFKKKNIFMLGSFKEYSSFMFFKGALLSDPEKILVQPTENSNSGRQLRFTNAKDILKAKKTILAYIFEATEIEKSGAKVEAKKTSEYLMPEELKNKFKELPELKAAFEKLTPGRQRGYLLHFSQAKQSATRLSRIEKCMEAIFNGKGMNE
ncbi:MAG: YdeI/OmpD-associated family protein [Flavobacteriales bacterium]|jgi:uncharacterized protein YdeI (YjbR/CyaY-like superfamily)|nr:YdeI/OmpD-associated family protein [Flavobacteriales bacterium]MDP4717851.1 YdeI/OmpD-associated family protein [Flavobacteriales bacterium]MDP4731977.1 YdeI/OmpD-associated family protein [Flavobacteriales bacterium]MDP4817756.1 YdeI/OmpD-associated family protein [Flavobacteriales bacterium]MDP4951505.1 YdeI/OmpD-associated family protein [Flavobacteriales bacterium]